MTDAVSAAGEPERSTEKGSGYVPVLLGALVTVLFVFVPFAPVAGGTVAGYLAREERGVRIGALSGGAAAVPIVLVLVFVLSMTAVIAGTFGGQAVPRLAGAAVGAALYTVVLSALGGVLGSWLHAELADAPGPDDL